MSVRSGGEGLAGEEVVPGVVLLAVVLLASMGVLEAVEVD